MIKSACLRNSQPWLILSFIAIVTSCNVSEVNQSQEIRKEDELKVTQQRVLRAYEDRLSLEYGILDVTKMPYSADNTGNEDVTLILQQALNDARDTRSVLYLPPGTYLVSNTITGIQGTIEWDQWCYEGFADPWLKYASFEYPNVIIGSSGEKRSKIKLDDSTPRFSDPLNPEPVIRFWSRMEYGEIDKSKPQPNISFNQKIIDLDFDLGSGNSGAIAIEHQGAEGSVIEDVNIKAEGAFAGICRAPGSGGAIHGVRISGGKYGFYIKNDIDKRRKGSQPSPVLSSVRLTGQTDCAVLYDGRGPLTIVGAYIEGSVLSDADGAKGNGPLNIIDAIIITKDAYPAVRTANHPVVLENVFIHGIDTFLRVGDTYALLGNSHLKSWRYIRRAAICPDQDQENKSHPHELIFIDKKAHSNTYIEIEEKVPEKSFNPYKLHDWPHPFPSWQSDEAVNVKLPPYNAKGDGKTDDYKALQAAIDENEVVFLPKGIYTVSRTLTLNSRSKLLGLGNVQSVITIVEGAEGFSDPDHPQAIIETIDDSDASTVLAFIKILVPVTNPCVYALNWRAGAKSIVRNVYPIRGAIHPHGTAMNYPMIKINGSGGGSWYTNVLLHWWDQGAEYRHLLIDSTSSPLRFYMLEPQHGRGSVMVEIKSSSNIDVYSIKSEGDFGVLSAKNSNNLRFFGYSGNGNPYKNYSLFEVEKCSDYLFANLCPMYKSAGSYGALGISHNREDWFVLKDFSAGRQGDISISGKDIVTLYLEGNPTSGGH